MQELDAQVLDHEPHLALDGGEQGTSIIEQLIPQSAKRLRSRGWLLIEVGPNNASLVEQLVEEESDLIKHKTISDLAGHPRLVQAQRKN